MPIGPEHGDVDRREQRAEARAAGTRDEPRRFRSRRSPANAPVMPTRIGSNAASRAARSLPDGYPAEVAVDAGRCERPVQARETDPLGRPRQHARGLVLPAEGHDGTDGVGARSGRDARARQSPSTPALKRSTSRSCGHSARATSLAWGTLSAALTVVPRARSPAQVRGDVAHHRSAVAHDDRVRRSRHSCWKLFSAGSGKSRCAVHPARAPGIDLTQPSRARVAISRRPIRAAAPNNRGCLASRA